MTTSSPPPRAFHLHLGLTPKRFQQVDRVVKSLQAARTGQGDPLEGFSDQAHQIRSWKSVLGFTPGERKRRGNSTLGEAFDARAGSKGFERAHYL